MGSRDQGASDANPQDEAGLNQEPGVFRKATSSGITGSKCRAQYGKRKGLAPSIIRGKTSVKASCFLRRKVKHM